MKLNKYKIAVIEEFAKNHNIGPDVINNFLVELNRTRDVQRGPSKRRLGIENELPTLEQFTIKDVCDKFGITTFMASAIVQSLEESGKIAYIGIDRTNNTARPPRVWAGKQPKGN